MILDWWTEQRRVAVERDPLVQGLERIKAGPARPPKKRQRRTVIPSFGWVRHTIKKRPEEFPSRWAEWEWERCLKKADYYVTHNPWVTGHRRALPPWNWELDWVATTA